jgi:hypothetical protein
MTTRLKKIALDCKALLDAAGCRVPHDWDAIALTRHQERRRVVWLSDTGTVDPASRTGGAIGNNGRRITLAATRHAEVQTFIYAETPELAEQLCDNVIVAISQVLEVPKFVGYEVLTQTEDHAGNIQRCECVLLRWRLPLPVPDEIIPLITADYVNASGDVLTLATAADEQGAFKDDPDDPDPDPWPEDGGEPEA